ncbi:MerR family transcriptional regulator [Capnocytophaga cynodegmi]|uniref:MerR family transcriptional regulator n=1 Tax=Capnocytophaga cynodegmi TaxID=28189 RepID=UPI0037D59F90
MEINLPDKLYYTIGEVAKAFDVNTSLIRFWEKEFEIINPKKNAKGSRKFSPDDVRKLQLIYHLVKEQGHTLGGARQKLQENTQKTFSNYEIVEKLERVKQMLIYLKESF